MRAAAREVAAAVLACSPPQQRVNENTNAHCLGEYKRKVIKETPLMLMISISGVDPQDIAAKRSCACALSSSEEKSVKERWASEEGEAEMGGGSWLSGTALPVEIEQNERWPEKPRLPSNLSEHIVQQRIPIFRNLTKRSEEVLTGTGIERGLLPMKSVWVESELHSLNNVTEDLTEGVFCRGQLRVRTPNH
ncbi:hypothetical protein NDU88_003782 [Pleurodeles waltl]|uniref:Uncharacterized protein n=1 Tax=Pleurodeles waltl TaxID=8319 RepID=A0AAV7SGZ6_PLEWA|nr:hypothetical protein NDU88_003782 [Pleurodeles waltl]